MDTKHTPGPWFEHSFEVWAPIAGKRFGHVVANLRNADAPDEEALANARLIAAAPELLSAAQDVVKMLDMGQWTTAQYSRLVELAKACAKATTPTPEQMDTTKDKAVHPLLLNTTPGPWMVTDGPQYGYNKLKRVNSASGKFGTVICERFSADGVDGLKEEVEANLNLIAAAPDLLAALVRLANAPHPSSPADCLTEQGYLEDRAEYDSALTDAREVLASLTQHPKP